MHSAFSHNGNASFLTTTVHTSLLQGTTTKEPIVHPKHKLSPVARRSRCDNRFKLPSTPVVGRPSKIFCRPLHCLLARSDAIKRSQSNQPAWCVSWGLV